MRYLGCLARPHSFKFVRYKVRKNVHEDCVGRLDLFARTYNVFKMLVPVKQVNAALNRLDIDLIIVPSPTFVGGRSGASLEADSSL